MDGVGQGFWDWLPQVLSRTNEDGSSRYTREEAEDFLALIALSFQVRPEEAPPVLNRALNGFLQRVATEFGEPQLDEEWGPFVEAYLHEHPVPSELSLALRQGMQDGIVGLSLDLASGAFLRFAESSDGPPPLGLDDTGKRGSGALAYFDAKRRYRED